MQLYDRKKEAAWHPGQKRWVVRWRDGDHRQRKQSFEFRAEAEGFMRQLGSRPLMRDQNRTVGQQWEVWRSIRDNRSAGHQANIDSLWRIHVAPEWEWTRIPDVRHSAVAAWATRLSVSASPAVARRALNVLSSLCEIAIRDDVIDRNPCDQIEVPVKRSRTGAFLTREQLDQVAEAMAPHQLAVYTLGLTGMRWGEMAGLQVRDLDLTSRRIHIRRHVTEVGGHIEVIEGTKTDFGRTITGPVDLLEKLAEQAKGRGKLEPLLPAARGGIRRHSLFYAMWRRRVNAEPITEDRKGGPGPKRRGGLGMDVHIHDLRHTAASLMIQSGAGVKVVQRQLGHKSATLTLDRYGHLFEADMDDLSESMGRMGL